MVISSVKPSKKRQRKYVYLVLSSSLTITMAELATKLLEYIDSSSVESFESTKLVTPLGAKDHQVVVGVIKSLTCHDGVST